MEADYLQATGKTFKPEDFKDESVLNMDDVRQHSPNPIGFNQPATAAYGSSPALFKYQDVRKQAPGFIRTDTLNTTIPGNQPASAKLGTEETQLEMPGLGKTETSTYHRELTGHGIAFPTDPALNKAGNKADIQRIISKGLGGTPGTDSRSDNPNTPGTKSSPKKPGAPSTENRALPVTDTTPKKPGAPGLDAELLQAMKEAHADIPLEVLKEAAGVYPVWRDQVNTKTIKPSKRDGFKFISAQLCRGKKRTLTPASMVKLLHIWQIRAVKDRVLKPNPKYSPDKTGVAKYLLMA